MTMTSKYTRAEKLLGGLDIAHTRGIEIGALTTPLLRPPEADIRYVDHADQASLREKYRDDPNVDIDKIVPIDAVWGDNTLGECFPGELFDYVLASHLIEHVPDVIGWLAEVSAVLRPGGRLILAIPDRRYTFDLLRRETSLAELVDAHLRGARRPTPLQVFDFNLNAVDLDAPTAWNAMPRPEALRHYSTMAGAMHLAQQSRAGHYFDSHCSVFTARSLLGLIDGMLGLGLFAFDIERFHTVEFGGNEMSLVLVKRADAADTAAARQVVAGFLERGVDSEGLSLEPPTPDLAQTQPDPQVVALRQALLAMQSSTCWRMTAPLRWLGNRLGQRASGPMPDASRLSSHA